MVSVPDPVSQNRIPSLRHRQVDNFQVLCPFRPSCTWSRRLLWRMPSTNSWKQSSLVAYDGAISEASAGNEWWLGFVGLCRYLNQIECRISYINSTAAGRSDCKHLPINFVASELGDWLLRESFTARSTSVKPKLHLNDCHLVPINHLHADVSQTLAEIYGPWATSFLVQWWGPWIGSLVWGSWMASHYGDVLREGPLAVGDLKPQKTQGSKASKKDNCKKYCTWPSSSLSQNIWRETRTTLPFGVHTFWGKTLGSIALLTVSGAFRRRPDGQQVWGQVDEAGGNSRIKLHQVLMESWWLRFEKDGCQNSDAADLKWWYATLSWFMNSPNDLFLLKGLSDFQQFKKIHHLTMPSSF